MKLIKQSYELLEQEIPVRKLDDYSGSHFREEYIHNMYKHIEKCGRVCYKSLDRITDDSAEKFVNGLIKSGHLSVLEHGVVYLDFPPSCYENRSIDSRSFGRWEKYACNEYSDSHGLSGNGHAYVTTNYRVIIENGWERDLEYVCEPTKYHELRHTVLLHSCIHVYKDLTRHRKMSFSIESTRFCNYSKGKFGSQLKFIIPTWTNILEWDELEAYNSYNENPNKSMDEEMVSWYENTYEGYLDHFDYSDRVFIDSLKDAENAYLELIDEGWQPQQAAEILPQCTAADVVMSGYDSDWEFVFRLRSDIAETGKPHPLVEELMTPLRETFKKKGWTNV